MNRDLVEVNICTTSLLCLLLTLCLQLHQTLVTGSHEVCLQASVEILM